MLPLVVLFLKSTFHSDLRDLLSDLLKTNQSMEVLTYYQDYSIQLDGISTHFFNSPTVLSLSNNNKEIT